MIVLAWAKDPELRRNGSSGGFIRAMLGFMLDEGIIADASVVAMPGKRLRISEKGSIRGRSVSSVYRPVFPEAMPCGASVVLPCENQRTQFVFELICQHMPPLKCTEGVKFFRGNGWPGTTLKDGIETPFKFTSEMLPRCKKCHRTHSLTADFVCADPWGIDGDMGYGKTLVNVQTEQGRHLMATSGSAVAYEAIDDAVWTKRMAKHGERHK